jgi:hypothetical protein
LSLNLRLQHFSLLLFLLLNSSAGWASVGLADLAAVAPSVIFTVIVGKREAGCTSRWVVNLDRGDALAVS